MLAAFDYPVKSEKFLWSYYNGQRITIRSIRTLLEIEELRWNTLQRRGKLYEKWRELFQEMQKFGKFWAKINKKDYADKVYYISQDGVSTKPIGQNDPEWFLLVDDKKLPIFLGDKNLNKECRAIVEDRLSGKVKQLPYKQDLHERYEIINKKLDRVYKIISLCDMIMKDYVQEQYRDIQEKSRYEETFLQLIFNKREYIYKYAPRDGFTLLIPPEKKPESITIHSFTLLDMERHFKEKRMQRYG